MRVSKKIWAILAITIVTTMMIAQTPLAYADHETVQAKVLNALRDIAGIDVDKYTITRNSYDASPIPGYEDRYRGEEDLYLVFESENSQLTVSARYFNNHLTGMYLSITVGSPSDIHYINRLPDDPLIATREVLSRLKDFIGKSVISDMQKIVDSVKDIDELADKTVGDIKCKVYRLAPTSYPGDENSLGPVSSVIFMYSFAGADSPKSVGVHFENDGFFRGFNYAWDSYVVGSDAMNVSREQAIAIAREQAIKAAGSVVLEFPSDRPVIAELSLEVRVKDDFMLYPFWFVELPLVYPLDSSIYGWQVGIWADTGEMAYSHPVGGYGAISDPNDQSNNSTASLQNNNKLLIAGIITTVAIISIIAVAAHKKR